MQLVAYDGAGCQSCQQVLLDSWQQLLLLYFINHFQLLLTHVTGLCSNSHTCDAYIAPTGAIYIPHTCIQAQLKGLVITFEWVVEFFLQLYFKVLKCVNCCFLIEKIVTCPAAPCDAYIAPTDVIYIPHTCTQAQLKGLVIAFEWVVEFFLQLYFKVLKCLNCCFLIEKLVTTCLFVSVRDIEDFYPVSIPQHTHPSSTNRLT